MTSLGSCSSAPSPSKYRSFSSCLYGTVIQSVLSTRSSTESWETLLAKHLQLDSAADYNPLNSTNHPNLNPSHCLLTYAALPKLSHGSVIGDSDKSLAEVKVYSIHCSPLYYPSGHDIIEGYQIGQA